MNKNKTALDQRVESATKKKGKKQKGAGTKKYGRNAAKCSRYKVEGRREKNKARKAARRIKGYQ